MDDFAKQALPLVAGHFSRLVARDIGLRQKDLGLFLEGSGLSVAEFLSDELMLTSEQQGILADNAYRLSGDPGLGLRVGAFLTPEAYGPLGFLVSASPNFRTAVEHIKVFLPPRLPFVELVTESDGDSMHCRLEIRHSEKYPLMLRAAIESVTLSLSAIAASIVDGELGDTRVHVDYPAPDYADRYRDYFSVPVIFDAGEVALRIPHVLADSPNPMANRRNYMLAFEQCQAMLAGLENNPRSTADRVRKVLLSGPPGRVTEEDVLSTLLVSKRTLTRRLAGEGTNFRQLRDEILSRIASHHLTATTESTEAIAALLNYYDSSNFRRAFKRWYGQTPEAYRKAHKRERTRQSDTPPPP